MKGDRSSRYKLLEESLCNVSAEIETFLFGECSVCHLEYFSGGYGCNFIL